MNLINCFPINIQLKPNGYTGSLSVTLSPKNADFFETNWSGSDVTRFPARIKAAATALRNKHIAGKFEISHHNGAMKISKIW